MCCRKKKVLLKKDESGQKLEPLEEVFVDVPACDMPGPTRFKAVCARCNTVVRDKREVLKNDEILCKPCAFGTYYQSITEKRGKDV